ncbi:hypothetical protein GIB67_025257 [Kingdonia uniflora]|uniref:Embryonic flower 1 n=1 Tax=Kingdonia uniflora TaxID=39325 RepID=A0A7J7NB11_9MAGN|nr:hypothetical protein GIB67_025257 [Kingdonia uniflora]
MFLSVHQDMENNVHGRYKPGENELPMEAALPMEVTPSSKSRISTIDLGSKEVANGAEMQEMKKCRHFSIRGYVSKVRKHNIKICYPFGMIGIREGLAVQADMLPSLDIPDFKCWECTNCVKGLAAISAPTEAGEVTKCSNGLETTVLSSDVNAAMPSHEDAPMSSSGTQHASKEKERRGKTDEYATTNVNGEDFDPSPGSDRNENEAAELHLIGKDNYTSKDMEGKKTTDKIGKLVSKSICSKVFTPKKSPRKKTRLLSDIGQALTLSEKDTKSYFTDQLPKSSLDSNPKDEVPTQENMRKIILGKAKKRVRRDGDPPSESGREIGGEGILIELQSARNDLLEKGKKTIPQGESDNYYGTLSGRTLLPDLNCYPSPQCNSWGESSFINVEDGNLSRMSPQEEVRRKKSITKRLQPWSGTRKRKTGISLVEGGGKKSHPEYSSPALFCQPEVSSGPSNYENATVLENREGLNKQWDQRNNRSEVLSLDGIPMDIVELLAGNLDRKLCNVESSAEKVKVTKPMDFPQAVSNEVSKLHDKGKQVVPSKEKLPGKVKVTKPMDFSPADSNEMPKLPDKGKQVAPSKEKSDAPRKVKVTKPMDFSQAGSNEISKLPDKGTQVEPFKENSDGYKRKRFSKSHQLQSRGFMRFPLLPQCREMPPSDFQFHIVNSRRNCGNSSFVWNEDVARERGYLPQAIPQQQSSYLENNGVWPPMKQNCNDFRTTCPLDGAADCRDMSRMSQNLEILPRGPKPLAPHASFQDREKWISEANQRTYLEHQFPPLERGKGTHQANGAEPLELYAKATIPAMDLLKFMDRRLDRAENVDTRKDQSFFRNSEASVQGTFSNFSDKSRQSWKSFGRLPPVPKFNAVGSTALQNESVPGDIFSAKLMSSSFKSLTAEKQRPKTPSQPCAWESYMAISIDGVPDKYNELSSSKDLPNMKSGVVGTGTCTPMLEICNFNQNPAEFNYIGKGNKFMIGAKDLRRRRR